MPFPNPIKTLAAAAAATVLAACGGGGTSDPIGVPPDARFDTAAALTQLLTTSAGWSVAGRGSDGRDYTATLSVAPGARAAYPMSAFGVVGRTSVQRSELRSAGFDPVAAATTVYFPDAVALPEGFAHDDGSCSTVEAGSTPSASATVGASGLMLSTIEFDSCVRNAATVVGTTEVRWSVEASDGVPYFCLTTTYFGPGQVADGSSDATCFEVDTAGQLGSRAIVRLVVPGFTLEMRS